MKGSLSNVGGQQGLEYDEGKNAPESREDQQAQEDCGESIHLHVS